MNDATGCALILLAVSPFLLYVLDLYDRIGTREGAPSILENDRGRSERPAHLSFVGKERGRGEEGCAGVVENDGRGVALHDPRVAGGVR